MLLQFNVSNFLSIKDEITLTAFANASKEHEDNLIILGRENIAVLSSLWCKCCRKVEYF